MLPTKVTIRKYSASERPVLCWCRSLIFRQTSWCQCEVITLDKRTGAKLENLIQAK